MTEHHGRCPYADDVAPFAIGALDSDATDAFATHIEFCSSCRADVEELQGLASMLPLAAERRQPPPELKQRVMAAVRSEAELLRAAGPEADRGAARRSPRRIGAGARGALVGVAAAAIVALVVVLAGSGTSEVRAVRAQIAYPSAQGRLQLRDGTGTLITAGMPGPGRGRVYAIWTQRPGEPPRFAGTLAPEPGSSAMRGKVEGDLDGVRTVMVTLERASVGGSPTAKPVLTATLA